MYSLWTSHRLLLFSVSRLKHNTQCVNDNDTHVIDAIKHQRVSHDNIISATEQEKLIFYIYWTLCITDERTLDSHINHNGVMSNRTRLCTDLLCTEFFD